MILNMIVAMAKNRVIWIKNSLPWHYSQDLKRFKNLTMWNTIVMWKNTYFSIWKPLWWRENIILSEQDIEWVLCFGSIEKLNDYIKNKNNVFIIWWQSIYKQFLDKVDFLYLTQIKKEYDWDTFFPEFENLFVEIEREIYDEFDFVKYEKNKK